MDDIINTLVSMFDVFINFLSNLPDWATAFITALIGAVIGGRYTLKGVEKKRLKLISKHLREIL